MTSASSRALSAPASASPSRAAGLFASVPPTVPTFSGSLISPTRSPLSAACHRVSDWYLPVAAAYAWAPASIARQSFPVAIATASMPFMMPLLCVAARYGSTIAMSLAVIIASRTLAGKAYRTRAVNIERSARLERIRSATCPSHSAAISGATASQIELTRLAPMASQVSTSTCTAISGGRQAARKDVSRCPERRRRARAGAGAPHWLHRATPVSRPRLRQSHCRRPARRQGAPGQPATGSWLSTSKPPVGRAIAAALLRPATIDGSSTTRGTTCSRSLTMKFGAIANGRPKTPTTFSIIWSAAVAASTWRPSRRRAASADDSQPCASSLAIRSGMLSL